MSTYQTVMFFLCFGMGLFFMYKFCQLYFISNLPPADLQHDIIQPPASLVLVGIIVCGVGVYRNSAVPILSIIIMALILFIACFAFAGATVKKSKKIRAL